MFRVDGSEIGRWKSSESQKRRKSGGLDVQNSPTWLYPDYRDFFSLGVLMSPTDHQPKQLKDDPAEDRLGRKSERMDEFVTLLGQNERRLFVYLKSRMPCNNDADDLLQETNLIPWREFDSFEFGTNFTAWAYRIAENQVRAARKRQQRA